MTHKPTSQQHRDRTGSIHRRPEEHGSPDEGTSLRRKLGLPLGPLVMLVIVLTPAPGGMEPAAWATAGLALFMAVWWVTEAVPIAGTALLPIVLIPLLDLGGVSDATLPYASPVIFLFLGGFMLAQAIQRWDLHRRVALHLIRLIGTKPDRLVAGFMVATAFLSMWVSNTATAVMMLPIGLSLIAIAQRDREGGSVDPSELNFAVALMLGIAYSASIGGAGTLIGTPPNALLAGFLEEQYGFTVGFGEWMLVGVPFVVVMLPITWVLLVRVIVPIRLEELPGGSDVVREELRKLGPPSRGEKVVGLVFVATALAWVTRPLLDDTVPGLTDAGIAVAAAVVLFALPVHPHQGTFALDWASARQIPWGVLVLFGGGLSLAAAITRHGLAEWIGESLTWIGALPALAILAVVALVIIFVTELTSNTASAAAFFPVLAALAISLGQDPLLLLVTAALGASCAFMLPVATPPNAIVYGSSFITIPQMARAGVVLNFLFAAAIPLLVYLLLPVLLGVEVGTVPVWAE